MNFGAGFILAIVAMSLAAGIINNYLRTKRMSLKKGELGETNAHIARLEHRLEQLGERVETVEKIVTDGKFDLKQTIENL